MSPPNGGQHEATGGGGRGSTPGRLLGSTEPERDVAAGRGVRVVGARHHQAEGDGGATKEAGLIAEGATDPYPLFTVDAITPDPQCTGSTDFQPVNGHFLTVAITFSTAPQGDSFFFTWDDWHIVEPDGVRENTNSTFEAFACVEDTDRFPTGDVPLGITFMGLIGLGTKNTSGVLLHTPTDGGWEWTS